jgi:hypothetical protein
VVVSSAKPIEYEKFDFRLHIGSRSVSTNLSLDFSIERQGELAVSVQGGNSVVS